MEEKKKFQMPVFLMIAGAYSSYTIGAGFASGNEVMQFFGSWGVPTAFVAALCTLVMTAYFCASAYRAGQSNTFEKPHDVYVYFCGKYVGWVFEVFVIIFVLGIFATMFSGAGSMLNQFLGLNQYVGSIIIGIIASVVVFGGFKRVAAVLGYAGILIIAFVVVVGIITLASPNASLDQSANVAQMVADGKIWQANLMELPPLSFIPGFAGLNGPVLEGFCYAGVCLIVSIPFIVAQGRQTKNMKEALGSGIFAGIFFSVGMILVICILLGNFQYITDANGDMQPIPALAAVEGLLGRGTGAVYMIILIAGIFTTITGYLWLLTDRVFGEVKNKKSNIFTAILMIIGVVLGGVLPFSAVVNFLWPLSGFAGIIFVIFMIVKDIRASGAKKDQAA
ncbi:MAG: hypothetical protein LBS67_02745 [Clostridiales Family XIII bacterium]|nr:hypothetical protein [Clostridiales Family XIII bacterium]